MKTTGDRQRLRTQLAECKARGQRIAFVPTMGNLHDGHLQLVRRGLELADVVVVSIFVNPLQFGAGEDLDAYPRTLAADKERLFAGGVKFLYTPTADDIYPDGLERHSQVLVPDLSETLCGSSRPGHFNGVATIVAKLFNIVQPDVAIFGEKDFQQLSIVRKMVDDLCLPVEVIGVPTVRDR